jgi:hypothetical protein
VHRVISNATGLVTSAPASHPPSYLLLRTRRQVVLLLLLCPTQNDISVTLRRGQIGCLANASGALPFKGMWGGLELYPNALVLPDDVFVFEPFVFRNGPRPVVA